VTYEGADILDVAQQAIDAKLENDIGFVHVEIEPDIYPVSNNLSVTEKGPTAISIESPSAYGAYLQTRGTADTDGIPDGETVFEFDPDAKGSASDRAWGVEVRGITIDDRYGVEECNARDDCSNPAHPHTAGANSEIEPRLDGLYINDCRHAIVDRFVARRFRTGLRLRNTWQAQVNYPVIVACGHADTDSASIEVLGGGHPASEFPWTNWPGTQNANNHVQLNHVQGNPRDDTHFFVTRSEPDNTEAAAANRQNGISFANVELQGMSVPGFVFGGEGPDKWTVWGSHFKGGTPSVRVQATRKPTVLTMSNCKQTGGGQLLEAESSYVTLSNCSVEAHKFGDLVQEGFDGLEDALDRPTGVDWPAIEATDSRLTASNLWVYHGNRGIDLTEPRATNISGCSFVSQDHDAIRITDPIGGQVINGVEIERAGRNGSGVGINLQGEHDSTLVNGAVIARSDASEDDEAIVAGDEATINGLVDRGAPGDLIE
jgi:hypothetical protein